MSSLVLDTNIVSYLMRGHTLAERYRAHLKGHILMISFMTIAEMHEGALRDGWGLQRMERLARVLGGYHVIWPDDDMCRHTSKAYPIWSSSANTALERLSDRKRGRAAAVPRPGFGGLLLLPHGWPFGRVPRSCRSPSRCV
ncbi:MAG: PIN domain-containing protein [Bacillota bacterium]